jgi:hypothetical protein
MSRQAERSQPRVRFCRRRLRDAKPTLVWSPARCGTRNQPWFGLLQAARRETNLGLVSCTLRDAKPTLVWSPARCETRNQPWFGSLHAAGHQTMRNVTPKGWGEVKPRPEYGRRGATSSQQANCICFHNFLSTFINLYRVGGCNPPTRLSILPRPPATPSRGGYGLPRPSGTPSRGGYENSLSKKAFFPIILRTLAPLL